MKMCICLSKSLLNLTKVYSLKIRNISVTSILQNMDMVKEHKINVDGLDINYLMNGTGKIPVLLIPGAIGSIWTDFKPQVENLNREKLTVVAWDPPGYGKSRPPNRNFTPDFFQKDATYGHNLMKKLGFSKFSLIGWSDGGITSLFLAANYPDSVQKMLIFGANSYILPEEIEIYKSIKDINTWSKRMREPLIEVYGEDYFRKMWENWVDIMIHLYNTQKGNLCSDILSKIKCPTFIIHGKKDRMVNIQHSTHLKTNIKNSKLHYFEEGAHNLHLRYPEEFNKLATEFLIE